jgi:hypothetical protein
MRRIILSAILGATSTWAAPAENLLGQGSFEEPVVNGRTPETDEGLIQVDSENTPWAYFGASQDPAGGQIIVGLTNEIARTGKQSLFVDFEKVTANQKLALLMTKLIPIKPSQPYKLSMWGRVDKQRPVALNERRPFLVVDVEYFAEDQKTKAGEPIRGFQLLPGNVVPGGPHPLAYTSRRWSESSSQFTTPEGAAFLRVKWTWQVPTDPGETDGVLFWDDATLIEDAPQAATGQKGTAPSGTGDSKPALEAADVDDPK